MGNKRVVTHKLGQPHKFQSAEELQTAVNAYLKKCRQKPSISALALHLGYCDRQSIYDLLKQKDDYSCIIRAAITAIESRIETMLFRNGPTAGVQWWLKVHGNARTGAGMWKDNQSLDVTSGGEKIQQSQVIVQSAETVSLLATAISEIN